MADPVRIETARLILDHHVAGDIDALADILADAGVNRHLGGAPQSRHESW